MLKNDHISNPESPFSWFFTMFSIIPNIFLVGAFIMRIYLELLCPSQYNVQKGPGNIGCALYQSF